MTATAASTDKEKNVTRDTGLVAVFGRVAFFQDPMGQVKDWSFMAEGYPGYMGFGLFEKGDILMIFNDAARTDICWIGTVDLNYKDEGIGQGVQGEVLHHIDGTGLVHGLPPAADRAIWAEAFAAEKPALLVRSSAYRKR